MSTESKSRSDAYSSTRSAFDELGMEEKACFLLESTAKAVVDGVQEAVVAFSDMFDGAFSEAFTAAQEAKKAGKEGKEGKEGAAKPVGKKKPSDATSKAKTAKPKTKTAKSTKPKSDPKK